jgi:hypothetical protein
MGVFYSSPIMPGKSQIAISILSSPVKDYSCKKALYFQTLRYDEKHFSAAMSKIRKTYDIM